VYEVRVHDEARATVAVLPPSALPGYLEVLDALETAPWGGVRLVGGNPEANILTLPFGPAAEGLVAYLVLDREREVHILEVQWVG
jgi:hypothetical protein